MDVADAFLGFILFITGFLLLLSVPLGILERLWPKRNELESDEAEPIPQSIEYKSA